MKTTYTRTRFWHEVQLLLMTNDKAKIVGRPYDQSTCFWTVCVQGDSNAVDTIREIYRSLNKMGDEKAHSNTSSSL